MKQLSTAVALIVLVVLVWALTPVYQFYAFRGVTAMPPWGWVVLEEPVPTAQKSLDARFERSGIAALQAMATYRAKHNLPSLSAAVAVDGRPVWAGAVGFSDIATQTPATSNTLFRIGSTSKALTATALARLVQRGALDLDRPLQDYTTLPLNPHWPPLTARQLASHSSGLPHYGDNTDWLGLYRSVVMRRHYADVRDAVSVFDGSELLFQPGSRFSYSSLGTVLLGAAMSEVSGLPYRRLMQEEVFKPAGMSNTFADGDGDSREPNLATLYYTDGARFRPWRPVDLSHRLPGGGYISSPTDLVKLGSLWLNDNYLKPQIRDAFWEPQRLVDGSVNEENYALGWRWRAWQFDGMDPATNANHGGVSRGSQCWLLVYPDYRMSMAFCTNTKTEAFITFGGFYEPLFRSFISDKASNADGR